MKPALTPEEWVRRPGRACIVRPGMVATIQPDVYNRLRLDIAEPETGDGVVLMGSADVHALAALCLYGQPFGFTHSDVAALRCLVAREVFMPESARIAEQNVSWVRGLADRIAALLPPKEDE